jgi:hypothetical protein
VIVAPHRIATLGCCLEVYHSLFSLLPPLSTMASPDDIELRSLLRVPDSQDPELGERSRQRPKAWHPKITGSRLLVILSTLGLGTAKLATASRGQTVAPITLEWLMTSFLFPMLVMCSICSFAIALSERGINFIDSWSSPVPRRREVHVQHGCSTTTP